MPCDPDDPNCAAGALPTLTITTPVQVGGGVAPAISYSTTTKLAVEVGATVKAVGNEVTGTLRLEKDTVFTTIIDCAAAAGVQAANYDSNSGAAQAGQAFPMGCRYQHRMSVGYAIGDIASFKVGAEILATGATINGSLSAQVREAIEVTSALASAAGMTTAQVLTNRGQFITGDAATRANRIAVARFLGANSHDLRTELGCACAGSIQNFCQSGSYAYYGSFTQRRRLLTWSACQAQTTIPLHADNGTFRYTATGGCFPSTASNFNSQASGRGFRYTTGATCNWTGIEVNPAGTPEQVQRNGSWPNYTYTR